jgi:hypothetical protein
MYLYHLETRCSDAGRAAMNICIRPETECISTVRYTFIIIHALGDIKRVYICAVCTRRIFDKELIV